MRSSHPSGRPNVITGVILRGDFVVSFVVSDTPWNICWMWILSRGEPRVSAELCAPALASLASHARGPGFESLIDHPQSPLRRWTFGSGRGGLSLRDSATILSQ